MSEVVSCVSALRTSSLLSLHREVGDESASIQSTRFWGESEIGSVHVHGGDTAACVELRNQPN